ncbi:CMRF35-like molecule 8 [Oncorhynchus mykiss]|uniref:Immunoglobulin domain-containing protein n=1 Tax=Oncorhynchus mykiss TaxID=8022 RepID=A0A8C7NI93_ONCMY|nr:CMRF35-like molecule 8 [Oncorhynchus mykiss]
MRILLIVILLAFMTGCLSSFKVTGYSGGTVIISCHYSTEDRSHDKYFCLGKYSLSCKDQIRTGLINTWKHSGRFSLYDNTEGNDFKVMIRQLTRQDEGTYWCGVDKPIIPDSYTKVELEVKKDDCCEKSVTETAFLGGEATIRCNYPEDHEDNIKYFCKEDSESDCENKISDTYHEKPRRYSLSKRRRERFSTVTISDLTEDDTGTYWCGVETSRTEQRYITLITRVWLLVIMKPTNTTTTTTAPPDPPTTTFISLSSSSSSPSSSSSSSPPPSSSSLNGSGTSVVIMVSVSLVVLLLLISLIIVYRWKYNKVTGSVSSTHRVSPDTGNNDGGCHGDGDYEEIKECPLQSDSDAATSTIYATANLPTSHSESPHYASVNFHKNPSSPNEATATITKEGSCPNEATAAITKEGTSSCDYATVNCQSPTYSTVNHPPCSSQAAYP